MMTVMRHGLNATFLAAALLAPVPQAQAAEPEKIGFVRLPGPLPFTPQEMAEPFGWKVSLVEEQTPRRTVMNKVFGKHLFTFNYDDNGAIVSLYSPLEKTDSDLCYALSVLKDEKVKIYNYLETNFKASSYCESPAPRP